MTLGEKLRQARLEIGLSQRQLCGEEITRNMLSQIENGSARPSMDTLCFLAQRLQKPVSWFLEEQTASLPNLQAMETARQAWAEENFTQVLQALSAYRGPDPVFDRERYLLEALALTAQAQAVAEDKPVYARKLLEEALKAGEKTPYFTQALQRQWLLSCGMLSEKVTPLLPQLPADDRELLLRARGALEEGTWERAAALLEAAENRDPQWHLLRGRTAMAQKDYTCAAEHYRQAEDTFPKACAQALEICWRELEDYKMAYHYACKLRELTEGSTAP